MRYFGSAKILSAGNTGKELGLSLEEKCMFHCLAGDGRHAIPVA